MADESNSDGLLMIRASRGENGELLARITEGTEANLEVHHTNEESEVIRIVQKWLSQVNG